MQIEQIDINSIKPYPKNAKEHPLSQIKLIAKSIERFGFNQPIVIDNNHEIVVGHGRLEGAKLLGMQKVPVMRLENLTENEIKAYRLADNQINALSKQDMDLVIPELKLLDEDLLELTGFDRDLIIEPDEKDDEIPENVPSRSKLGDLYELGAHRVLCGDSTQPEAVLRLMDGKKADMVFTDPPYGVSYEQGKFTGKEVKNRFAPIANDELKGNDLYKFIFDVFANILTATIENASYYVWSTPLEEGFFIQKAVKDSGVHIQSQIIWDKERLILGRADYHWQHEICWYGYKGKGHYWCGDRRQTSIWKQKRDSDYKHPTQKPVELSARAISNSTQGNNNIVLDLFLGSGSTLIASEKTGRICYGMELDCKYVDVCIERWCKYTGITKIKKNGVDYEWELAPEV